MTIQHPEFAHEQQYVDHAYDLLDRGLAEAEQNIVNFEALHRSTAHAMNRALSILRNSRGSGQLVFGRIDRGDQKLYIGRRRVYDEDRNLRPSSTAARKRSRSRAAVGNCTGSGASAGTATGKVRSTACGWRSSTHWRV
jgi:hypothetical protein